LKTASFGQQSSGEYLQNLKEAGALVLAQDKIKTASIDKGNQEHHSFQNSVLFIDDSISIHEVVKLFLRGSAYTPVCLRSGEEALALPVNTPFQVAFIDLEMLPLDGWQTLDALKKSWAHPCLFAMMSGNTWDNVKDRLKEASVRYFLPKPFSARLLLECLNAMYGQSEESKTQTENYPYVLPEIISPTQPLQTDTTSPKEINKAIQIDLLQTTQSFHSNFRGDEEQNQDIMPGEALVISVPIELKELLPEYLTKKQGEWIQLEEGLAREDWQLITRIGHNMKGTGKTYGLPQISVLGQLIEQAALNQKVSTLSQAFKSFRRFLDTIQIEYTQDM